VVISSSAAFGAFLGLLAIVSFLGNFEFGTGGVRQAPPGIRVSRVLCCDICHVYGVCNFPAWTSWRAFGCFCQSHFDVSVLVLDLPQAFGKNSPEKSWSRVFPRSGFCRIDLGFLQVLDWMANSFGLPLSGPLVSGKLTVFAQFGSVRAQRVFAANGGKRGILV
jgi:hypothetical protein